MLRPPTCTCHAAGAGVDGGDGAALGVGDAHAVVVAFEDDVVADREVAAARDGDVPEVEAAGVGAALAGELVEAVDVDATLGHHQLAAAESTVIPPRVDQRLSGAAGVGERGDSACFDVPVESGVDVAAADFGEGLAFVGSVLASVLFEGDEVVALGQGAEHAAGVDLGELVVVADEHDFDVGRGSGRGARPVLRVGTMPASSTTRTVFGASRASGWRRWSRRASRVPEVMPLSACSWLAACLEIVAPRTRWPLSAQIWLATDRA